MSDYSIIRADRAGVFMGIVESKTPTAVVLRDALRIYRWSGALSVEHIAKDGILPSSKITVAVDSMEVANWIQIIPCTDEAAKKIKAIPAWKS